MFKRRKPEEPPAPQVRGHVIASGPRPEIPSSAEEPRTADMPAAALSETAPAIGIPPMPETPPLQQKPAPLMQHQIKESSLMSRPPLQPTPISPTMAQGMGQGLSRTPMAPARLPQLGGDRRTLVVGRGISVQGTITDAERLVVEGTVEASSLLAAELQIAQGGVLKGQVEVEDAEISGLMDGTLTVKGSLVLRGTGQVTGEARCRRLQVEDGGQLSGKISMITDVASSSTLAPHLAAEAGDD